MSKTEEYIQQQINVKGLVQEGLQAQKIWFTKGLTHGIELMGEFAGWLKNESYYTLPEWPGWHRGAEKIDGKRPFYTISELISLFFESKLKPQ